MFFKLVVRCIKGHPKWLIILVSRLRVVFPCAIGSRLCWLSQGRGDHMHGETISKLDIQVISAQESCYKILGARSLIIILHTTLLYYRGRGMREGNQCVGECNSYNHGPSILLYSWWANYNTPYFILKLIIEGCS